MRRKSETISKLLQAIERIELEVAELKTIVLEAITEEDLETDIFVQAAAVEGGEPTVLADVEAIEDTKPKARPTKRERILKARRLVKAWVESLEKEKKQKRMGPK